MWMGLRTRKVRLAAIALVAGLGVTASVASAGSTALVTVNSTQNTSLGKILVSSTGHTLYHLSSESKNAVKCTGSCATEWPPLLISPGVTPVAAPGVTASLLGTVKRPDGKLQVTYRGLALYMYSGDKKAGDVKGQGASGWHAIAPTGSVVLKALPKTSSGGTKSSGSGAGSSSGSGSGSGSSSGGTGGGGTNDPNANCDTNPGGYGCM
jgi:predicted lipoprotein with Yx(FWY)xxD motif